MKKALMMTVATLGMLHASGAPVAAKGASSEAASAARAPDFLAKQFLERGLARINSWNSELSTVEQVCSSSNSTGDSLEKVRGTVLAIQEFIRDTSSSLRSRLGNFKGTSKEISYAQALQDLEGLEARAERALESCNKKLEDLKKASDDSSAKASLAGQQASGGAAAAAAAGAPAASAAAGGAKSDYKKVELPVVVNELEIFKPTWLSEVEAQRIARFIYGIEECKEVLDKSMIVPEGVSPEKTINSEEELVQFLSNSDDFKWRWDITIDTQYALLMNMKKVLKTHNAAMSEKLHKLALGVLVSDLYTVAVMGAHPWSEGGYLRSEGGYSVRILAGESQNSFVDISYIRNRLLQFLGHRELVRLGLDEFPPIKFEPKKSRNIFSKLFDKEENKTVVDEIIELLASSYEYYKNINSRR